MTEYAHKLLDGRKIAVQMHEKIRADAKQLDSDGWPVRLVSIAVGESEPAALYIRNQARVADKVGISFEDRFYPETTGAEELAGIIQGLNADPRVSGVIIQRPLPAHISVREMQRTIHPFKDVEGMHPSSIGNIVYNDLVMGPCTAVAAVEILKTTPLQLEGLEVVVIGHSDIVGKPIAFLLMGEGATVTVCHAMTRNLAIHSRQADAVFVAVGKPGLVTAEMLKPGAAVIDIGINQIQTDTGETKVVGDVDFKSCVEVAGWITPVPGGVGPVTVATLMRNAVRAATLQRDAYRRNFSSTEHL